MFAHNCTACSLHCELQSGVTFHADCSSHKLLSGKPLQSRKNHWASPVLIYSCRLEKHQPQWDRCLTKIRAGKMSLPNMPWGVKCTWKLRNVDEIHGLGSVPASDAGPASLHHEPAPSLGSRSCKALSRARRRGWEPGQHWAAPNQLLWVVWLCGWR